MSTINGIPVLRCGDGNILRDIQQYDEVVLPRRSLHALYNTVEMMNYHDRRMLALSITMDGITIKGKNIKVYDEESMTKSKDTIKNQLTTMRGSHTHTDDSHTNVAKQRTATDAMQEYLQKSAQAKKSRVEKKVDEFKIALETHKVKAKLVRTDTLDERYLLLV